MSIHNFTFLRNAPALVGVALFFGVWTLVWLPIAIPLAIALQWHPKNPITVGQKLPLLASLYLLAPLILWGIASITNSSFTAYGLPWKLSILTSWGVGLVIGVLGLAILFGTQTLLGWIQWIMPQLSQPEMKLSWNTVISPILLTLIIGVGISLIEELVFRGFLISQLQQDYAPWLAAAIASLIFAVLHLVWEGRENIPQLPGLWLMGMVLTLARWVDGGNLGLAWGLHAGWIWAIASLDTTQVLTYTDRSVPWLTGLGGKPVAGAMGILFLLGTGAVLWGVWRFDG